MNELREKIEELVIKADVLNDSMLMAHDAILEGSSNVENYRWSLYDLHEKTFDMKEELHAIEDYLFQIAKAVHEPIPVS